MALGSLVISPLGISGPAVETASELRGRPRPRVTLVAHDVHDAGGMEHAHAEVVRALHHEFDLTVISATLATELQPLVAWERIRVPQRPFFAKFGVFFIRGGFAVGRSRSDLVHTLGAIVPNRVDVASLHFCHEGFRAATGALTSGGASALRRASSGLARLLALGAEHWCYRPGRLQVLAAVSEGVRQEAAVHFPTVEVRLTPNGVDTRRFVPDLDARSATRRAAGVGAQTCVALFVGGDWARKGLLLAVEGLAKARAEGVDLVLWVVGAGDEQRFARSADELGVREAVTFFGRRGDPERFYQGADLFVLPSGYETFSLACFEAAACGLPLVIPKLSGAGELVGDDEGGILVERDAASVADAMSSLSSDPERRTRLGEEARRRAGRFTWEASTAAVAGLYGDLLRQGRS